MATDCEAIVRNLSAFYPFDGKTVVVAGAGGGHLAEYARPAARVIAVDPDRAALDRLTERVQTLGFADKYSYLAEDFLGVHAPVDLVLFEFCLHP